MGRRPPGGIGETYNVKSKTIRPKQMPAAVRSTFISFFLWLFLNQFVNKFFYFCLSGIGKLRAIMLSMKMVHIFIVGSLRNFVYSIPATSVPFNDINVYT